MHMHYTQQLQADLGFSTIIQLTWLTESWAKHLKKIEKKLSIFSIKRISLL